MKICQESSCVHVLQPGRQTSDHLPDALHHQHDVLVPQGAVPDTLVEQLDQSSAHVVVFASVNNLHCQHVQRSSNKNIYLSHVHFSHIHT